MQPWRFSSPSSAARTRRRIDRAVGDVQYAKAIVFAGAEFDFDTGRATIGPCAFGVSEQAPALYVQRMGKLVHFDAVLAAHAGVADMDDRHPSIGLW